MATARALLLAGLLVHALATAAAIDENTTVLSVTGSGTTNPSKLLWRLFDDIESQAGSPVRVTYRGVGSGVGISEFLGNTANNFQPYANFGCADIPLSRDNFNSLQSKGQTTLQIPFVLGAVSFFHTQPSASADFKLSPCTLAKVFLRQITTWDDPAILAENPGLDVDPGTPITVVHRTDGSSSTAGATEYLYKACPSVWPATMVGSSITWPADTVGAQGSDGVAAALERTSDGVTYLASSFGYDAGFNEIRIQNLDGTYLTWPTSDVSAALQKVQGLPSDYTKDMSAVGLTHLAGPTTWPITQLSYIFIRTDQAQFPKAGPLLKMIIQMLFSDDVQKNMFPKYGFTALPQKNIDDARANLEKIQLAPGSTPWAVETSTQTYVGQGSNVLSAKRKGWVEDQVALVSTQVAQHQQELKEHLGRQVDGSGSSIPSGLIWHAMETLKDWSTMPLELTYRSVGSGVGQQEFIAANNRFDPYNDFGVGDLPLSSAQYQGLSASGHRAIQLPFLVSAIGVFHSIPASIAGPEGVKLDSCLLARIFQANITSWDHEDILALNPQMRGKVSGGNTISIFHREAGSSTTFRFSSFLQKSCPKTKEGSARRRLLQEWGLGAGLTLDTWPQSATEVQGSNGMADAIAQTPFSIGYGDAEYGWRSNLQEVALKNKDGNFLTTRTADIPVAAVKAVQSGMIPTSATSDFSGVDLIDQAGPETWPITHFSFFYVRENLQFLGRSGGVLKAFLAFMLSDELQGRLREFGFYPPPPEVLAVSRRGIDDLILPAGVETWQFEEPSSTMAGKGASRFVFSSKRHTFTKYQTELLSNRVQALEAGGPSSGLDARLKGLEDQNQQLRIIASIALAFGCFSVAMTIVLLFLIMCRRNVSPPCADPCVGGPETHVQMKEYHNETASGLSPSYVPPAASR